MPPESPCQSWTWQHRDNEIKTVIRGKQHWSSASAPWEKIKQSVYLGQVNTACLWALLRPRWQNAILAYWSATSQPNTAAHVKKDGRDPSVQFLQPNSIIAISHTHATDTGQKLDVDCLLHVTDWRYCDLDGETEERKIPLTCNGYFIVAFSWLFVYPVFSFLNRRITIIRNKFLLWILFCLYFALLS